MSGWSARPKMPQLGLPMMQLILKQLSTRLSLILDFIKFDDEIGCPSDEFQIKFDVSGFSGKNKPFRVLDCWIDDGGNMNMLNGPRRGLLVLAVLAFFSVSDARADRPAKEEFRERIPTQEPAVQQRQAVERRDESEWKVRLSPGVTVWFFDKEDNEVGAAAYMDFWRTDLPWNFRVGVEGAHIDLEQDNAAGLEDGPGREPRISYFRIPFSVEYMMPVAENTTWYIGGGPDILHTANDLEETEVGMHLGTRVNYAFDEHWGVAVEGGYMWGDVKTPGDTGGDLQLDGWYVTPTVGYVF